MIYTPMEARTRLAGRMYRNEDGDGGAGGSMGSSGPNSGGFGSENNFSNYSGQSSLGVSSPSFAEGGFSNYGHSNAGSFSDGSFGSGGGGDSGLGEMLFDTPMAFNAAKDSQMANAEFGLGPNTDFSGDVSVDGTQMGVTGLDNINTFLGTPFGRVARGLVGMTPLGAVANLGLGLANRNFGQVAGSVIGGLPGAVASMGINAAMGKDVSGQAGSTVGGMIGSSISPGIGGMVGSALGGMMGNAVGRSGGTTGVGNTTGDSNGGFDLGGAISGLGGMYSAYQNGRSADGAAGVAQQQTQQLADMYGPNSPYASQLRQQLERKDAAGGRRSQYGPREVELQAKLAEMATRNAPNVLAANKAAYDMRQNGIRSGGQGLSTAINFANKSGLTGYAQRQLGGMFNSGNSGNGNSGGSTDGVSYNNPSAYTAPSSDSGWPSADAAASYGSSMNNSSDNFWDNW